MQIRDVSFVSDNITLSGHLRVPEHPGPHPAVVLDGPLSGVKEQVTGLYADRIAEAGYVTLAFDHRNFGASGGTLRQHEDAAGKLRDLRAAVSFLAAQPDVLICLMGGQDQVNCLKQFVQFGLNKRMKLGGSLFELEYIPAYPPGARVRWLALYWS